MRVAEITQLVGRLGSLPAHLRTAEPQAAERLVELLASLFPFTSRHAGGLFHLLPAIDELSQIVLRPPETIEHLLIDLIFVELVFEPIEDEIGRFARMLQVSLVTARLAGRRLRARFRSALAAASGGIRSGGSLFG